MWRMTIELSEEERAAMMELAMAEMRPLKQQIRYVIREAASRRGLLPAAQAPANTDLPALIAAAEAVLAWDAADSAGQLAAQNGGDIAAALVGMCAAEQKVRETAKRLKEATL